MPKEKREWSFAICKNCDTRGHRTKDCHYPDPSTRNPDKSRILREMIKSMPPKCFSTEFVPLEEKSIRLIKTNTPGIYELGRRKRLDGRLDVCYLGMSSDLRERLLDHCLGERSVDGFRRKSHISGEMERIRKLGHHLFYRFTPKETTKEAEQSESEILAAYDYVWNIDQNGKERRFFI